MRSECHICRVSTRNSARYCRAHYRVYLSLCRWLAEHQLAERSLYFVFEHSKECSVERLASHLGVSVGLLCESLPLVDEKPWTASSHIPLMSMVRAIATLGEKKDPTPQNRLKYKDELLTAAEVSARIGISVRTPRTWADDGIIKEILTKLGNTDQNLRLYRLSELVELASRTAEEENPFQFYGPTVTKLTSFWEQFQKDHGLPKPE